MIGRGNNQGEISATDKDGNNFEVTCVSLPERLCHVI